MQMWPKTHHGQTTIPSVQLYIYMYISYETLRICIVFSLRVWYHFQPQCIYASYAASSELSYSAHIYNMHAIFRKAPTGQVEMNRLGRHQEQWAWDMMLAKCGTTGSICAARAESVLSRMIKKNAQ